MLLSPLRCIRSCRLLPLAACLLLAWAAGLLPAQRLQADDDPARPAGEGESAGGVSYYSDIRPIFQTHCQGCHQPAKPSGEYVMTSFERLTAAGESGEAAVVPGEPDASYLIAQITPEDGEAAMPQDAKPLAAAQIELIRRWIAEGAKDDTPMSARPQYDMDHPPVYRAPPVLTSLSFSPDGKLLAVSGYHEVVLHQVPDNPAAGDGAAVAAEVFEPVARLVGMSERIESAVFSPEGKRLAVTGGSPGRMGEVQIWNVEARQLERAVTVGYDTCYGASWSPDGKLVAFGCPDNSVRAIDVAGGEQVLFNGAHNDWVLDTVFAVKSDHLVTVSRDMSMKLIKVDTQRFIDNITSITPGALKGGLNSVDRHPSKDEVVAGGADGTPKIYKMYRDKDRKIGDDFNLIRAFSEMPGRVFDVRFSADGGRIVAGSSYNGTGELRAYNVEDGKQLWRLEVPEGGIYSVAFHPGGKLVAAGGFDGYVRLVDAASGKVLHQFYPVPLSDASVASASSN